MKLFLVAAVAAVALTAAAQAAPPAGFYESFKLEPAASFVAGKPVKVWCATSQYDWLQYGAKGGEQGLTTPGSSEVKIAPDVCRYLRAAKVNPDGFGASLLVLVHESIHARGERDEGITDCSAVHEMPRVAVRFFRVKAGKQLRAVMANAWRYRSGEPAAYRSTC